jgi:hypothetical protein
MSQLTEIYDGWKNLIFLNPEVEAEAKRRIEICVNNECGKFTTKKTCSLCGCFMPAKVRSPKSKCKINKW